jgi:hypothetical protein
VQQNKQKNLRPLTLLFVHIGTKPPKYLLENIQRTRKIFPDLEITLLTDVEDLGLWANLEDIEILKYQTDEAFDEIFKFGELEEKFRDGYWRHTIERLVAIKVFHDSKPDTSVLHIESDVILLPHFPLSEVSQLRKVHWLNYGDEADIATMIFLPTAENTIQFHRHLIEQFEKSGGSDMEVLWNIRKEFPEIYSTFPTANSETQSLLNLKSKTPDRSFLDSSSKSFFDGIFDACGIGIWVFGSDPRNNYGVTKVHTRELIDSGKIYIDASNGSYFSNKLGEFWIRTLDNKLVPVYNIHVHSKNMRLLSTTWIPEMEKYLKVAGSHPKKMNFQGIMLVNLVYQNIKKKSLFRYLLYLPPLKRLRELLSK